jgi:hypothetical protein
MSPSRLVLVLLFAFGSSLARAQQTAQQSSLPTAQVSQRDPQALSVLTQALSAAGGSALVGSHQNYTGTGSITYYWANQEVQGSVNMRSRGTGQFRLDATLPNGVRTWLVNDQTGLIREPTGYTHEIPFHNAVNFGSLTLPYPALTAALNDPGATILYLGSVTNNGRNTYQIRVQRIPIDAEPSGVLHTLSTKDFFIDATNFQIVSTLDMVHPDLNYNQDYPHEITFSDYRAVNRVLVPFSTQERVAGQHSWTIQLTGIDLNPELTDEDFQMQELN